MKQKNNIKNIVCKKYNKTLRIMKISTLLIFISAFSLSAESGYSQDKDISLKLSNVYTIENVISEIEKTTDYVFIYNEDVVPTLKKEAKVDMSDQSLDEILNQLIRGTDLAYSLSSKQVTLYKDASKKVYAQIVSSAPLVVQQPSGKTITGRVTDTYGEPLPGVTVLIRGTSKGTITDVDGNFSLTNVPVNATLQFSFVGMKMQEILIGNQTRFDVVMVEEAIGLAEVVAIGYGVTSRKTLTGSVSIIDEEQLGNRRTTRTTDLLQGMAAGVQVQRSNSARVRGTTTGITIRGVTSRSNPGVLVVIDGITQADNSAYALDNINPNDIENISILKDAQASIYGARASGGVILITTKKGKEGKPTINFSADYTLQKPSLMRKPVNIIQHIEMHNEAWVNDGQNVNLWTQAINYIDENELTFDKIAKNERVYKTVWPFDPSTDMIFGHYDWSKIMFATKPMQTYNVSISGRTDRINYYNSISYIDQKAMMKYGDNYNKRLSVRLKNDLNVTDYLKVKTNFSFENQKVLEPTGYNEMEVFVGNMWANIMPFTPEGNLYALGTLLNPIGYARESGSVKDLYYRINSKVGMDLTPFENLTFTGEISSNYDILENEWANLGFDNYNDKDEMTLNSTQNRNSAGARYNRSRFTVSNVFGKYTFTSLGRHKLDIMAGYSHEELDVRSFSAERRFGLISHVLPTFGMGDAQEQYNDETKFDWALNSYFSRLTYGYKDTYLFEGIARYDGSSKFAKGHKWSPFWGFSGAWIASNESFMKSLSETIDFLKFRASWGLIGNQASIGNYDHIARINIGGVYPMGNPLTPSLTQRAMLSGMVSNERSWEKIDSKNIGVDISLLNSRLSSSFDYYIKNNRDMFYSKEFPEVLGETPPSINGAHVRTSGWDLVLGWRDKIGDFGYFINLNLSNNNTKVIELADQRIPRLGVNNFVEGYPAGSIFGYRFAGLIKDESQLNEYKSNFVSGIPGNLTLGDVMYKDLDGDKILRPQAYEVDEEGNPTLNSGDMEYLGDAGQHYLYGLNLGGSWKNFDLKFFFQGVLKWNVMESKFAIHNMVLSPEEYFYHATWSPDRPDALYPRLTQDFGPKGHNYQFSDAPFKLFNNRYIRLKNIQLGYSIPNKLTQRLKINTLRVYFSGEDLWEWHDLPGIQDPEKPFLDRTTTPIPFSRGFTFGVNFNF